MTNPNSLIAQLPDLTIREHFAALAMQGLLAEAQMYWSPNRYADAAVSCADALIARLNQKEEPK